MSIFDNPNRQTATATVEVAHADPVTVNGLLGIAVADAAIGEAFEYETQGTLLCAVPADTVAGDFLYAEAWNEVVTLTRDVLGAPVARAMSDRDGAGRAQVLILPAPPFGAVRLYKVQFAFDDIGLERGIPFFTPRPGDVLLQARVQVDEAFDDICKFDFGTDNYNGIGGFKDLGGEPAILDTHDVMDNWLYNGIENDLANLSSYNESYTVPGLMDPTVPLKLWVTNDGVRYDPSTAPQNSLGRGTLYIWVGTAIPLAKGAPSDLFGMRFSGGYGYGDPNPVEAATPFEVKVRVVDEGGYLIGEAEDVDITLALSEDTPGALTGTLTKATERGIATFDDLELEEGTGFVLIASADGLPDAAAFPVDAVVTP